MSPCANQFNTRGAVPVKPKAKPKPKDWWRQRRQGGSRGAVLEGQIAVQHEYQHGLDSTHDEEAQEGGRGGPRTKPKGFVPFSGAGMKLGGGGGRA